MLKKKGLGWKRRGLLQGSIAAFSRSAEEDHRKPVRTANSPAPILTSTSRFQTYTATAKHCAPRRKPNSIIEFSCV
jgi:hypothetical protein